MRERTGLKLALTAISLGAVLAIAGICLLKLILQGVMTGDSRSTQSGYPETAPDRPGDRHGAHPAEALTSSA